VRHASTQNSGREEKQQIQVGDVTPNLQLDYTLEKRSI